MKNKLFLLFVLFFFVRALFCQTMSEIEPNGCITLVGGEDSYQTLYDGSVLFGSVSAEDLEGCLYFEYTGLGNEYIEDLFTLEITTTGYYALSLFFSGNLDLDFYLMDEELNLLNPDGCGSYNCGITCGTPETLNIYFEKGRYILGVSLPTVYYCFPPAQTNYFLTVSKSSAPQERPTVTSLAKASNPYRLLIFGKNFSFVSKIYISGSEWQKYLINGDELIKLKKGKALKRVFPKDGSWVPITIVNSSNSSTTILYNRLYNLWQEGGF